MASPVVEEYLQHIHFTIRDGMSATTSTPKSPTGAVALGLKVAARLRAIPPCADEPEVSQKDDRRAASVERR